MSTPTSCPFCGATPKSNWTGRFQWFTCGTMVTSAINRNDQTRGCEMAERLRLTRERDEALERAAEMTFQAADAQLKHEAATRDLARRTRERDEARNFAKRMRDKAHTSEPYPWLKTEPEAQP